VARRVAILAKNTAAGRRRRATGLACPDAIGQFASITMERVRSTAMSIAIASVGAISQKPKSRRRAGVTTSVLRD
jgi:hypothetical protein